MQIVEAYFYLFHHSLQIIGPGDDAVPASPKKNEKDSLKRFVITIFLILIHSGSFAYSCGEIRMFKTLRVSLKLLSRLHGVIDTTESLTPRGQICFLYFYKNHEIRSEKNRNNVRLSFTTYCI